MSKQLPKCTPQQMIGNIAASELKTIMLGFCIFTEIPQEQDFGIDFIGTILNNNHPSGCSFNVQCKGTDDPEIRKLKNGSYSYSIKVSTINYWKQQKDVTFLFLVDTSGNKAYWTAPLREIESKDLSKQKTYTFHIPVTNCITKDTLVPPVDFKEEIIRYYSNFSSVVVEQIQAINEYVSSPNKSGLHFALEILNNIEKNMKDVTTVYNSTIKNLLNSLRMDMKAIVHCLCVIDCSNPEIRYTYFPDGVYELSFTYGKTEMKTSEFLNHIEKIIEKPSISPQELQDTLDNVSEYKKKIISFTELIMNIPG